MTQTLAVADGALSQGELPIGAIVVLRDEVIAEARTSERGEGRFLVHADLLALEQMDRLQLSLEDRREASLFVNLEPCMMCLGAAMSSFIGHIFYGLHSPGDGAVEWAIQWPRKAADIPGYKLPKIAGGVLADKSQLLFERYVSMHSAGAMWRWAKVVAELEPLASYPPFE